MNSSAPLPCPICSSEKTIGVIKWSDYTIRSCSSCKLIHSHPFPSNEFLNEFYQGFLFNIPDPRDVQKQIEKRKVELSSWFNFDGERKNFLDYGGGTGSAYKAAVDLGLQSYYHDLDKEAQAFVIKEHGLEYDFIINDFESSATTFDFVFSDNVIEHVLNPVGYVSEIRKVLNTGGEVIIKTPHGRNTELLFHPMISLKGYIRSALKFNSIGTVLKAYFHRFWHCDPPRHLYSFSAASLKKVAIDAGFEKSEVEILYYRIPLFKYSLLANFFNFRKRQSAKTILLKLLVLPVLPIELFAKSIQWLLMTLNLLTPAGITLKLRKLK